MKISNLIWKIIDRYKINYIFGIAGSHMSNILHTKPANIKLINVGNELDNGFIAQSYGLFSQKIGILIVTSGPGIATSISSIANAIFENNPLVTISFFDDEKYNFQNWDIRNVSKSITKNIILINKNDDYEKKINYGFYLAETLNTGVFILLNKNVLLDNITYLNKKYNFDKIMKFNKSSEIVKELKEKLTNTNIVLILGYIPHINYKLLEDFLNSNNIPYIVTWKNRTITNTKYYCGLIGSLGNHSANYISKKATNLLIIGDISIKLVNNIYQDAFSVYYLNNKNVYSLVLDKSMAYEKSKKIYITNDFNYIFKNLKINVSNSFLECVSYANSQLLYMIPPKSELEKYCCALSLIYNNNNLDIPFVTGVGNHWYAMGKYFRTTVPNNWFSSTEWASIGCGYFYGIGAYLAQNKPVWILEGDGGTAFSGTSLLYLINNRHLPITTIIINDKLYSAVYSYLYNFNKQKYISKTDNIISSTPTLNTKLLPNCHEFNNVEDFYKYLNKYPTSNQVRFIIIHINKSKTIHTNNSFVYGINIHDEEYINLIKNNDFLKIKNYTLDHKLDIL